MQLNGVYVSACLLLMQNPRAQKTADHRVTRET